jgi:HNH endonuclease
MKPRGLAEILKRMKRPRRGLEYVWIKTIARADGQIERSAYTHWVGFTGATPRLEIREASIMRPSWCIARYKELSIPYVVVSDHPELVVYLHVGGTALVEKNLAKEHFASVVLPRRCTFDGPLGFKSVAHQPPESFFRSPRPKLRMKILKRDQYRCRICGRRPADYTDVELHVHHIRPWGNGGLTEEQNLVTLCHSCHNGLSPHEEHSLFDLIGRRIPTMNEYLRETLEGMQRYQQIMAQHRTAAPYKQPLKKRRVAN